MIATILVFILITTKQVFFGSHYDYLPVFKCKNTFFSLIDVFALCGSNHVTEITSLSGDIV